MIVICRHKYTLEMLKELGVISESDKILDHVENIEEIKHQDVLGTLPIDLASECKSIWFIEWDIPLEARGREWTKEETYKYYRGIDRYKVFPLSEEE